MTTKTVKCICFLLLTIFELSIVHSTDLRTVPKRGFRVCKPGTVYVGRPASEAGCYPLARLKEDCVDDLQCFIPKSYCSIGLLVKDDDNDYDAETSKCACRDGHTANSDQSACVPFRTCSNLAFNHNPAESPECGINQFCHQTVCQCLPKFQYNSFGECLKAPIATAFDDFNDQMRKIRTQMALQSTQLKSLNKLNSKVANLQIFVITLLIVIVAVVVATVFYQYLQFRDRNFNRVMIEMN